MGDRGRRLRREGGLGRRGRLRGEGGREQRWVVGGKRAVKGRDEESWVLTRTG